MAEYELIPYSVAASFRKKLTSSAFHDIGRIYGVTDQLQMLKDCIESIETELFNVEETQENSQAILAWLRNFKDVLHSADDFFDDIATESLRPKRVNYGKVCSFFSSTNGFLSCFRIAREINEIQKRVNYTRRELSLFNLPIQRSEADFAWRLTSSEVSKSHIIGRENEKTKILSLLMESHENENVSLIGIVGVGGIGKTVVAQMVYNDNTVRASFDLILWACVSEQFDVRTVVKTILFMACERECNDSESLEALLCVLRERLRRARYLLVLDDVWIEIHKEWALLSPCLMCGQPGSKILVTTRSEVAAKVMGVNTLVHLEGLSEEYSWSLFKNRAFGNDGYPMNHTLEAIGKQIAIKCGGIPLTISTVASALYGKRVESEWIDVLEGDFWKLGEHDIMPVLKLSYQHLSSQLKQCFAYVSVYPKGWEIEKNELIQLWMAQDYLECLNDEQQMEDVGNNFVNTFLETSFFQDEKFDEYRNQVSFKIHDLMHDLALAVAGNDYYLDSERRAKRPMHMCFSFESDTTNLLGSLDASRLRTFFLWQENDREIAQMTGELYLILRFKGLRVLNISRSSLKKLPDLIGTLKHLRYLDLSWCVKLASLPKSIGNLVNLQTLKLTGCESLEFSTEVVTRLISLRHLEIHRCKAFEVMMPVGLGKLSSLQSLSSFQVADYQKKKKKKKAGKLNELQN